MDFDEAVAALQTFEADNLDVDASVYGSEDASSLIVSLGGVLRRRHSDDDPSPAFREYIGEEAVVFTVGDGDSHTFSLWPSRFVDATQDETNGLRITTRDGRLSVRKNRPWVD